MNIRPLLDWVLVKLEPLSDKEGSIFLVHGGRVRKARVLAVGPGRKTAQGQTVPPDVHPGDQVVFFREHLEHQQGKALVNLLDSDTGLIREPDILFAIPEGSDVKVSV